MRVVVLDPEVPDPTLVADAAKVVRRGGVIAYPTDTVYGLGADPFNTEAVRKIFAIKGREARKPLSLIVADEDQLLGLIREPTEAARRLMQAFWPGTLTLVLPLAEGVRIPALLESRTLAVRVPASALCRSLAALCGPLTATSANLSGKAEPTSAAEVQQSLGRHLDMIIDGGRSPRALPSTIVDVSVDPPVVLRPGAIAEHQIRKALECTG